MPISVFKAWNSTASCATGLGMYIVPQWKGQIHICLVIIVDQSSTNSPKVGNTLFQNNIYQGTEALVRSHLNRVAKVIAI